MFLVCFVPVELSMNRADVELMSAHCCSKGKKFACSFFVSSVSGENCSFGSLPGFLLGYWVKLGHGTVGLTQIEREAV